VSRNAIPIFVLIACLVALVSGWWIFAGNEANRHAQVRKIANSFSDVKLGLTIQHDNGSIAEEDYRMEDRNGISTSTYRAIGRGGTTIKIENMPHETFDVSFLFGQVVQDGIWELQTRPPRGDTSTHYTVDVYQFTNGQHGSHEFTFTDPQYWASTGGRQYTIHLDKTKPVPTDLLQLSSTSLTEPRYGAIVKDFMTFGSNEFRKRIADAKVRLEHAGS
jgi:hypothetical protein